jgi:hypothetical protein
MLLEDSTDVLGDILKTGEPVGLASENGGRNTTTVGDGDVVGSFVAADRVEHVFFGLITGDGED